MKTSLFKQQKAAKKSLSSFKFKAQVEQESLDTLISGLMGNCHDDPQPFGWSVVFCPSSQSN